MANRCTLHKTKLEDFKAFLDSEGIAYRPGKGGYQVLQVLTGKDGWQIIYKKNDMPEHFSVNDKLMPVVRKFLREQTKNNFAEIRDNQPKDTYQEMTNTDDITKFLKSNPKLTGMSIDGKLGGGYAVSKMVFEDGTILQAHVLGSYSFHKKG